MPWPIQAGAGKGGEKSERASGEGVRNIFFHGAELGLGFVFFSNIKEGEGAAFW